MTEIRKSINYIRENWQQYDRFLASLKKLIKEIPQEGNSKDLVDRARSLFSSRKDWKANANEVGGDPFNAIRVYTAEAGYSSFFAVIYALFRKDNSTESEETIRAAVFLVELLNIDLFNYCLANPSLGNFQGTVYRGLSVSQEDLTKFRELFTRPISQRYISVPLGLMSSSLNRAKAEEFLSLSVATSDPSKPVFPLLMVIHVIELKPEHLQFYREKFPDSVVTGICAVNVEHLSYHRDEREVILRGPFFQVLGLAEGEEIAGRGSHVLEMVMLNSNRDHVTSVRLGEREAEARQLFGTMVGVTRCEFCVNYCRERGLVDDERDYGAMLAQKREQLTAMMSQL
nr:hypothetical protein BaRGS_016060 [Batillaria attramentaria]